MGLLHYIWYFLLALAVLIAVHEYGHYLAARLCGVKVLRFSLGFGRTVFLRRIGPDQTEWAVSLIPLGGYVRMLDESEGPVAYDERHRAFNLQPVWKRAIIVVAGPLANFLLAIVVYWAMFIHGSHELPAVLGPVANASVAQRAGLVEGERIVSIDGESVASWADVRWLIVDRGIDRRTVEVVATAKDGSTQVGMLDLSALTIDDRANDVMGQIGLSPVLPLVPAVIGTVVGDGAGQRAGLREGDRILAVNGQAVSDFREFARLVAHHPGQPISLRIQRGAATLDLAATPDVVAGSEPARGRLGVGVREDREAVERNLVLVDYGPVAALSKAVAQTWNTTTFSLKVMWKMIVGEVSIRNVSGPVTIADYAGQTARAGFEAYMRFLALVSISLGVLNLLPVPILDGGHLLYYVAEAIRGKPLSERVMELGQKAGFAILASLMALAFFNDINRLLFG
ncbi:MAG: RIP metalloprotease RseP [Rhodocyclaceae bacterium]